MFNTIFGAGAVGAGAASRYGSGSGSDQKMRLLAALAPQHWKKHNGHANRLLAKTTKLILLDSLLQEAGDACLLPPPWKSESSKHSSR
jgi:hypothetical protein